MTTVAELIAHLQTLPPDATVVLAGDIEGLDVRPLGGLVADPTLSSAGGGRYDQMTRSYWPDHAGDPPPPAEGTDWNIPSPLPAGWGEPAVCLWPDA